VVDSVLSAIGYSSGMRVRVESDLPRNFGLGALWAHQVAASFAAAASAAKTDGGAYDLRVDKFMKERFLRYKDRLFGRNEILNIIAGAGGKFGRLAASTFGGFVVCNSNVIVRRGEMEDLGVRFLFPKKAVKSKKNDLFGVEGELAWGEALRGNLYTAMRLNALIEGDRVKVEGELKNGALSVSTTPKGLVAGLYRGNKKPKDSVGVDNTGVVIEGKPKKIVKTTEFLRMKGDQEFTLL